MQQSRGQVQCLLWAPKVYFGGSPIQNQGSLPQDHCSLISLLLLTSIKQVEDIFDLGAKIFILFISPPPQEHVDQGSV